MTLCPSWFYLLITLCQRYVTDTSTAVEFAIKPASLLLYFMQILHHSYPAVYHLNNKQYLHQLCIMHKLPNHHFYVCLLLGKRHRQIVWAQTNPLISFFCVHILGVYRMFIHDKPWFSCDWLSSWQTNIQMMKMDVTTRRFLKKCWQCAASARSTSTTSTTSITSTKQAVSLRVIGSEKIHDDIDIVYILSGTQYSSSTSSSITHIKNHMARIGTKLALKARAPRQKLWVQLPKYSYFLNHEIQANALM